MKERSDKSFQKKKTQKTPQSKLKGILVLQDIMDKFCLNCKDPKTQKTAELLEVDALHKSSQTVFYLVFFLSYYFYLKCKLVLLRLNFILLLLVQTVNSSLYWKRPQKGLSEKHF